MARGNFGERLKRERELREVTLKEITSATRIGPRFLEALENEEWEKLPGGVFNRGFVRSVARYLGLDEESFLSDYDLAYGPTVQPVPERPAKHYSSRPKWIPLVALLIAILILGALITGGVYAWRRYGPRHGAKQFPVSANSPLPTSTTVTETSPSLANSTSAVAPANPPAGGETAPPPVPLDLHLSLSAPTRLRILADGKLVLDEKLAAGDDRHFPANEEVVVTADNSSAVLLELNGQTMPPLGAPGASGTITLSRKDLRPSSSGNNQP
jgi:cytoskeletal protein RodZ